MNLFNPDHALERQIRDFNIIPLSMGRFLISSDTKSIFYDLQDERIQLTDIITLDTEAQRESILTPFDKFYFVKEDCMLWRHVNSEWKAWPCSGAEDGASKAFNSVLTASGWVDNKQVVKIEGLEATQNGVVGLSQNVSLAELEAASSASIYVSGQAEGSFTLSLGGDKPTCDIPITVILFN